MNQREIDDYRKAVTHGTCWIDDKQCNQCTSLPMCNLTKKLLDTIETQQQEIEKLHSVIDATRGVLGYPQDSDLKRFELSDSVADAARYWFKSGAEVTARNHGYMLRQQKQIEAQQQEIEQLQAQAVAMRELSKQKDEVILQCYLTLQMCRVDGLSVDADFLAEQALTEIKKLALTAIEATD